MKKLIFLFFIITLQIHSQSLPETFQLENELKLKKNSSTSPVQLGNSITDIVVVGDTIILGTGKGLSISYDRGESWINFYNHPDFGTESISAVAYKNGYIWVATAHSVERDGQILPEGSGLRFSSDGGKTWKKISQPVDHKDSNKVVYGINVLNALPITTTISNITYDIGLTSNAVWIASFAGGLRKSTDLGRTWQRVVLPPDYLDTIKPNQSYSFTLSPTSGNLGYENNLNHRVFSIYVQNDTTIFVGTANGINKSTDGGLSWVKFTKQNQTNHISGNFVVAISGTRYQNTDYIFAATWKAEDLTEEYGISISSDGGLNWNISNKDVRIHNFGFLNKYSYAAGSSGLFRSDNFGASWIKAPIIVDSLTKQRILTSTFYSVNTQGTTIWAGSNEGLARTTETGFPWAAPWRVYLAFVPVKSKSETYAYPNPFDPEDDVLKIKYTTNGQDAKVTIRIFDFGMNLVKTIIQNALRSGAVDQRIQQTEFWNGKDEFGNYVSNGVYFYSVQINDEEPVWGKILVIR
ncbi:MAG: hypothetical protein N3F03_06180 [Ignavibacteria bacterium]|nr:hypothetical protein [Ignavibacteria bacterium]